MKNLLSVALVSTALCGAAQAQYPSSYGYVPNYAPPQIQQMAGPGSYQFWNASGSYTSGYYSPSSSYVEGKNFSVGGYAGSQGYGGYYNSSQFQQGTMLVPAGIYNYGSYQNQGSYHTLRYYGR